MYKNILRSLDDASLFPIIAVIIFFTFFVLLMVYVFRLDKNKVKFLASMPLRDDEELSQSPSQLSQNGQTL